MPNALNARKHRLAADGSSAAILHSSLKRFVMRGDIVFEHDRASNVVTYAIACNHCCELIHLHRSPHPKRVKNVLFVYLLHQTHIFLALFIQYSFSGSQDYERGGYLPNFRQFWTS